MLAATATMWDTLGCGGETQALIYNPHTPSSVRRPRSRRVFLPHLDPDDPSRCAAPAPGEVFRQSELKATLEQPVAADTAALAEGKIRKEAIYAAYARFYRGDIA